MWRQLRSSSATSTIETPVRCKLCGDTGVVTRNGYNVACECQKIDRREIYRKYSRLPEFTPYPLIPVAQGYVDNFDSINRSGRNWIGFFGKTGSGKSTQAFSTVNALLDRENPVQCRCFWYPDILHDLSTRRYDTNEYEEKLEQFLDAELVLIDDYLDVIPRPESFEEQVALTLIKRRYMQRKPLIFTTEITSQKLKLRMKNHAEALIGRIVEMCDGRYSIAVENAINYRLARNEH